MTSENRYRLVRYAPRVDNVILGDFLEPTDIRNEKSYEVDAVRGISIQKCFIDTKADMTGVSLSPYKVVNTDEFAYVTVTSRNGGKISLAMNEDAPCICSSSYETFRVKDSGRLNPAFLYLFFNRSEFDRYSRFNSWGSARETFNWEDMCRVKIPLPPIDVQKAYVDAYKGLTTLIEQNEVLLKTLEQAEQACITECKRKWPMANLGDLIQETDDRNSDNSITNVRGISIQKCFINTKADMKGVSLTPYKIVHTDEFAYVTVTSRNGGKISLAMNDEDIPCICSSSYETFRIKDSNQLDSAYLYLFFNRPEFNRYSRFNSWGSARETFNWADMCRVKIPLPPIEVQKAIIAIYKCAEEARKIADEARKQLTLLCPAMIQRASHQI